MEADKLPSQVIMKPYIVPIDEERDMVIGHTIGSGGFIFEETDSDHIYFQQASVAQAWLAERGYRHTSDLEQSYMATSGLHGIYSK